MDYVGMLKGKTWVEISEDFDYLRATKDFLGLKLFPMFKTENMKLAVIVREFDIVAVKFQCLPIRVDCLYILLCGFK